MHDCHGIGKGDITNACVTLEKESEFMCQETLHSSTTLDISFGDEEALITLEDILEILIPKKTYILQNKIFSTEPINYAFDAPKE